MNIGDCVQFKDAEREGWIGVIIFIYSKAVDSDVLVDFGSHGFERCAQDELDLVDCEDEDDSEDISFEFYDEV